jgi:hypothetical protein
MRGARCWFVLLLFAVAACRTADTDAPAADVRPCTHAGSLATTLEPLVRWFGEGAGRTRFMTLLSPT